MNYVICYQFCFWITSFVSQLFEFENLKMLFIVINYMYVSFFFFFSYSDPILLKGKLSKVKHLTKYLHFIEKLSTINIVFFFVLWSVNSLFVFFLF